MFRLYIDTDSNTLTVMTNNYHVHVMLSLIITNHITILLAKVIVFADQIITQIICISNR